VIVITGATGAYGAEVAAHLLNRVPAGDLAVCTRDPARAADLAARGVDVRHGDFDRPDTLAAAFAGADIVLVNGTNYGTDPAVRGGQHAAAIRAATAAGATRVAVTSWQDLDHCPMPMAADFWDTERAVAEATDGWTVLRMVSAGAVALARDVRDARAAGELAAPAGRATACPAAVADLAEATATVLVGSGHEGRTYELTGPDAISWADLAGLAGPGIPYRPAADGEFRARSLAAGWPVRAATQLLSYYGAYRAGWANTPGPDLGTLLGRAPTGSLDAVREVAK
jgi:NAD(P)H dehydrogenase (quinone)